MSGEHDYGLSRYQLMELMAQRRSDGVALIREHGGMKAIADHLKTDLKSGISCRPGELEARTAAFGANVIPPSPPKSFLALCVDAVQDKTLLILIGAAIISLILGVSVEEEKEIAWIEGFAILVAVVVVVLVTALNDWTKDRQFRGLQKKLDTDSRFSVIRNDKIEELTLAEIVVGDVAQFKYGNTFPVDGILIQGFDIRVDEASLTGEAELVKKKVDADPMLLAGTQVMEGGGTMLVTAVGPYSQQGMIFQLMTNREDEAGFIVKWFRGIRDKYCTRCKKQKDEEDIPYPQLQSGPSTKSEEAMQIEEVTSDDGNPPGQKEEGKEEEPEELKGLAKLNPIARIKRRKKVKKVERTESTSTESGSVLQRKLDKLAVRIGYAGTAAAVLCVIILILEFTIKEFGVEGRSWNSSTDFSELLHFVIIGITVLVVAVPEGLPLAVTISLAYSVKKMLKDNNLVRHLHACETMGNATAICSDKTGTLTTNRMTVVESYFSGNDYEGTPPNGELPDELLEILKVNIAVNSSYSSKLVTDSGKVDAPKMTVMQRMKSWLPFQTKNPEAFLGEGLAKQVGNVTECALLGFLTELGFDYEEIREQYPVEVFTKVFTFNSARKSMSTVLPLPGGGYRIFTKGASEIVLSKCTAVMKDGGNVAPLTSDDHKLIITSVVKPMAGRALRTIALAYRDFPSHTEPDWEAEEDIVSDLVLLGIVGIQDPVRPEVPACIRSCQDSGITVRMVTGDNVETARAIAYRCGIISRGDGFLVVEGADFRKKVTNSQGEISQEKLDGIWPRLRVLARSSPQDKHTLVNGIICSRLHKKREVVAVTGDGTNDGPALKRADVGFAMGIAGTDVAKEASDIILTDDNFASIVKAVSWGRNVYDSISKFLQFQLTVNLVAVTLTLTSAVTIGDSPLRALQLLWVNLIMDTLASLALATESPSPDLLKRKPYGRNKSLVSRQMWVFMLGHSLYQLAVLFTLLFAGSSLLNIDEGRDRPLRATPGPHFTVIFNTFVFMQIFNEINARKIHGEWNVFTGIHKNIVFLFVVVGQVTVQILIVEFGDIVFNTSGLTWDLWLWCIFLGSTELLVGQLLLLIPVKRFPWRLQAEEEAYDETDDPLQEDSTRARVLWMKSLTRLRTQIRVVNAFRQGVESGSMGALSQLHSTPRPVRHNRPVTGIETAV